MNRTNTRRLKSGPTWINSNPGPGRRLMSMATLPLPDAVESTTALDIPTSWVALGVTDEWQIAADSYRADANKRLYLYNGTRPATGSFAIEDDGVALRVLAWAHHKKRIDRWFYWNAAYYDNYQGNTGQTNVFQTAQTFGDLDEVDNVLGETGNNYLNGDGVLLYPGTDTRYPGDSYDVMGPFASLRLKHWRRGIQDVDYLTLSMAISPTRTAEIVDSLIPKVLWEYGVTDAEDPTYVHTDISWPIDPDDWEGHGRTGRHHRESCCRSHPPNLSTCGDKGQGIENAASKIINDTSVPLLKRYDSWFLLQQLLAMPDAF